MCVCTCSYKYMERAHPRSSRHLSTYPSPLPPSSLILPFSGTLPRPPPLLPLILPFSGTPPPLPCTFASLPSPSSYLSYSTVRKLLLHLQDLGIAGYRHTRNGA